MTSLQVLFLIVVLVPLLARSWRWGLFGLSMQGALLAAISWRRTPHLEPSGAIAIADFVLLRAFLGPRVLARTLRARHVPPEHGVVAPDLIFWAIAGTLVALSFEFGNVLAGSGQASRASIAVPAAALLLGLLVLTKAHSEVGQAVGLLRVENAVALFELSTGRHQPWWVQVGMTAVFLGTLAVVRHFLAVPPPLHHGEGRVTP